MAICQQELNENTIEKGFYALPEFARIRNLQGGITALIDLKSVYIFKY
jgi:hypothetical protein